VPSVTSLQDQVFPSTDLHMELSVAKPVQPFGPTTTNSPSVKSSRRGSTTMLHKEEFGSGVGSSAVQFSPSGDEKTLKGAHAWDQCGEPTARNLPFP
jgi:hypothetical protein